MIPSILKRAAGLDVHSKVIVATILIEDAGGIVTKVTREFLTFRPKLEDLARWLSAEGVELAAMESTSIHWRVVYEALEDHGVAAIVVNAWHMSHVPGRKTDIGDSEWIAELARCGLLRASFVPPRDIRDLRMLTRYRMKIVKAAGSEKQRLHKILDICGVKLGVVVSSIDGVSAQKMLTALLKGGFEPEDIANLAEGQLRKKKGEIAQAVTGHQIDRHRFLLKQIQDHLGQIEAAVERIDRQVARALKPYRESWHLLQTIPGIDEASAAMLLAEIGVDMGRFGNKHRLASWAGLCPGNHESAGKKKSGKTTKGNYYVRRTLCECAHAAAKTTSQFKGLHDGLVIRRGKKRAVIAVAHKQLEIAFTLLKNKQPYRDPQVSYEELVVKRNAPRWIEALKKYGYVESTIGERLKRKGHRR